MQLVLISLFCWLVLIKLSVCKVPKHLAHLRGGGDDDDELPPPPTFQSQIPGWATGLPDETLRYLRQGVGQQIPVPQEYGAASDWLQQALQYQPDKFQYPMEEIQKALQAQQAIQFQDYLKQVRPMMAQQGQLDSSAYTNLIGEYMKGQQAQQYGTTAELLTQQALQNLQTQRWLPEFQTGVAGHLAGLGQQQAALSEANIKLPYQTYIPGFQDMYRTGLYQAEQQYGSAMDAYNVMLENQERERQRKAGFLGSMGTMGGMALGAIAAPFTGGLSLLPAMMGGAALGGAASPLWGGSGGGIDLSSALAMMPQGQAGPAMPGSYQYNPKWGRTTTPQGYLGAAYIPRY
ncbi:MAG TPA: hypothetical protein ENF20_06965 [Candidatus Marinimicrobia bacterium]|nr:hypothetical protein [Candidatus Neomarinimicrobiota bacterium]